MTEQTRAIPRGLKKRGRTWHISRVFNGRLVRLSTGCVDLDSAIKIYRRVEAGQLCAPQETWWRSEIEAAENGRITAFSRMLAAARSRSKKKGLPFDLTLHRVLHLASECGGRCSVSGVRLHGSAVGKRKPFLPSLDRIDCSLGYTFDNCRIVALAVNYAMSDFGEEALRIIARAIVRDELDEATNSVQ
jgi:hypothetical protein